MLPVPILRQLETVINMKFQNIFLLFKTPLLRIEHTIASRKSPLEVTDMSDIEVGKDLIIQQLSGLELSEEDIQKLDHLLAEYEELREFKKEQREMYTPEYLDAITKRLAEAMPAEKIIANVKQKKRKARWRNIRNTILFLVVSYLIFRLLGYDLMNLFKLKR